PLETVAAGQAPLCLVPRSVAIETNDDLLERIPPAIEVDRALATLSRLAVIPEPQHVERRDLVLRLRANLVPEPGVDLLRGPLAVTHSGRHGPGVRHHVAAGEYAGASGPHVASHDDGPIFLELDAGDVLQKCRVRVLAECEH